MRTATSISASTALLAIILASIPSHARAGAGECQGRLHQDRTGLWIGGGRGEDESICLIGKSDRPKVLAVCIPEQPCRVRGHMANCKDSGECSEISRIVSVRKR
jgi:hypothetical protein